MALNLNQIRAVNIATEGHNILLMGPAGTGKTHVLRHIHDELTKAGNYVQLTCSTGIACTVFPPRYNAVTMHQFTGIDDGRHDPETIVTVLKNNPRYSHTIHKIMSVDVLIVDECSMISRRTFETLKCVCELKDPSKIFGGIQIIFSGDFLQLPPVPNKRYNDDGSYCFLSEHFEAAFPHRITLTENVRQNDHRFATVISQLYSGHLSEETFAFLDEVRRPLEPDHNTSIKLYSTNVCADEYNRRSLLKHHGDMLQYHSRDDGDLSQLQQLTVPKTLWLKIGCPVILLRNLSNILVNGLQGKLVDASSSELTVEFITVGITTTIKKLQFTVFDPSRNVNIATREQFPVKPAFALTIHKAQGMTLSRVEVDCREIFQSGQLGVAISRASSSDGLRVINFHPKYVITPPALVTDFIQKESTTETMSNLDCCRNKSAIDSEISTTTLPVRLTAADVEDNLEDDFNDVIASIDIDEGSNCMFEIPTDFNIESILLGMRENPVITESQSHFNDILSELQPEGGKLLLFVKKIFIKLAEYVTNLKVEEGFGIPEKKLAKFYQQVHGYSTSTQYIMSCMHLFPHFEAEHKMVCYLILEAIRMYVVKQKVDLLKLTNRSVTKRFVTDASKPRIRYVAGYCVATIRKKYMLKRKSKMFSSSTLDQTEYERAKIALDILNSLKEEEHYIKKNTSDPYSLIDIDRRQNVNRGLTNVTDSVYKFFVSLTSTCLSQLVNDNLLKYGKAMYENCLQSVQQDSMLYEQFSQLVVSKLHDEKNEDFDTETKDIELCSFIEDLVETSAQILGVYNNIVQKYLLVLFAQFRQDVKTAFRVEKTMAHRKQIKLTKGQVHEPADIRSSVASKMGKKGSGKTSKSSKKRTATVTKPSEPGPSTQISDSEMYPEMLSETMSQEASEPVTSFDISELCGKCHSADGEQWIQCDACDSWYHRKCAGFANTKKWKQITKKNAKWFCNECQ